MKELVLDSIKPQPEPISQPPSNASFLLHLELLTEYFGFNPMDFVDEIINTANDLLYKAMDELEKILRLEIKDEALVERVKIPFKSKIREWPQLKLSLKMQSINTLISLNYIACHKYSYFLTKEG